MDRWLVPAASSDFERLKKRILQNTSEDTAVPTLRGWADALFVSWQRTWRPGVVDLAISRVGAFVLEVEQDASSQLNEAVLVAAERCSMATSGGLAPLMRPSEWRNAKRALTEEGWEQDLIEELVTPTTYDGSFGTVDPVAVTQYFAQLDSPLRTSLLRYFSDDINAYFDSWSSLAEIGDALELPADVEVIVPWEAMLVVRNHDGQDHVRP